MFTCFGFSGFRFICCLRFGMFGDVMGLGAKLFVVGDFIVRAIW